MTDRTLDHHGDDVIHTDRPPRLLPSLRDLAALRLSEDLRDRISESDPFAPRAFAYLLLRMAVFVAALFGAAFAFAMAFAAIAHALYA